MEKMKFQGIDKVQFYEKVKFGMDIVLVLKICGWLEVVREWILRE